MSYDIRIEDAAVKTALAAARKEIGQQTRQGLLKGVERILPEVRVAAPRPVAAYLVAKGTTRAAYITTRGPKVYDRIAGLLEFGGSPTSDISPRKKQAISTPWGPRAIVYRGPFVGKTPHYIGKHRIGEAVRRGLPVAEAAATDEVMAAFGALGL